MLLGTQLSVILSSILIKDQFLATKLLFTLRGVLEIVLHSYEYLNLEEVSTRVELRSVDPSTNPYLALAVLLASGLDGIQNNLPVPAPIDRNIYTMNKENRYANNIHDLPKNLGDALVELSKDQLILVALGEHISRSFVEAKEIEVET